MRNWNLSILIMYTCWTHSVVESGDINCFIFAPDVIVIVGGIIKLQVEQGIRAASKLIIVISYN